MIIPDDELKNILIKDNLLNESNYADILEYVKNADLSLTDALVEKNIISDEDLGILVADYLKFPFISLAKTVLDENVIRIVPERLARSKKIIPFTRSEEGIKAAMADPRDIETQVLLAKKTGQKIIPYLATEKDIGNTLRIYRKDVQKTFNEMLGKSDIPVAKIVDLLVAYAYQDKASDLHIEPREKESLVRFRIDGMLHDILFLPKDLHDRVATRIKVLSRLRTDEHLSAQDGKMRVTLEEEDLDIRVSIVPVVDGEKVVMRLLSSKSRQYSLLNLGMSEKDLKKVSAAFNKPYGMILSTGPTGSGKSTSIYAILKILNTREKNITTVEDPVEYKIKGVNQIHVNVKTGLTFASGLRSILRQDPNIIFVGEIRDTETAGIAVNAALTGHLVLSTLHTNDAATALPRLTDMKVEPFLVASTVNVIIAQRLIRMICDMCKTSFMINRLDLVKNIPEEIVKKHFGEENELRIYKGKGCKTCHSTGYSGRVGLFEVLEVSKEIKHLIIEKADSDVIAAQAFSEGMTAMLDDGLEKVSRGITSLEEVVRATKIESL